MRTSGWFLLILCLLPVRIAIGEGGKDLEDLSGQVVPLVSSGQSMSFMTGGELFSDGNLTSRSDIQYTVQVKNQTGDPIIGSSLILVVEQVMEEARIRDATTRIEILGSDGQTEDGKAYYHVPTGDKEDLPPYGVSEPILVRIRNPDLLRLAPPTFGIFGIRRTATQKIEDLREALIQKGILSQEEANQILGSPPETLPLPQ